MSGKRLHKLLQAGKVYTFISVHLKAIFHCWTTKEHHVFKMQNIVSNMNALDTKQPTLRKLLIRYKALKNMKFSKLTAGIESHQNYGLN